MSDSVVDTDTQVKPETEVKDAQDLDSLLNEYEQGQQPKEASSESADSSTDSNDDVVRWARQEMIRGEQERMNKAISDSVETLKDGLDVKIPDKALRGMLFDKAESDPRFRAAWGQRDQNPAAFRKVLKAMQNEIKDEFGELPDKTLTDDREALASAVRGATKSTTKEETQDFDQKMKSASDSQFAKELRELGL